MQKIIFFQVHENKKKQKFVRDADALMNPTECFENHEPRVLDEFVQQSDEEKIVENNGLAFLKFLTGTIKVEVDVQMLKELGDRITVRVRFLLMHFIIVIV